MTQNSASLAALVSSRLCHDLISPIGAIQNGLELLAMGGDGTKSPELSLIEESCQHATARISFYRVAFGQANPVQTMAVKNISETLHGLTASGRVKADWIGDSDCERRDVQLSFLAFLCCETALPMGGTVQLITQGQAIQQSLLIRAEGTRINTDANLWQMITNPQANADLKADKVQFALLPALCKEHGKALRLGVDETKIIIEITQNKT